MTCYRLVKHKHLIYILFQANLLRTAAEVGLLEPILLRKVGDHYQISAVVMDITDSDMAVFALAENVDREDLSDYEIGLALKQVETSFPTKKKLAESLRLNREDMYRYYAYMDLPEFIITDLNTNPRLLSRSAASYIKRLLNQNKDNAAVPKLS